MIAQARAGRLFQWKLLTSDLVETSVPSMLNMLHMGLAL